MAVDGRSALLSLVGERAGTSPDDVALLAPGRPSTTYLQLQQHLRAVAGGLRSAGIGPSDRVALVVENGPEAAAAFLAIASAAACAPLNPSYRSSELEFYLRDLNARAVVVGATLDTPARDVAADLGIDVLELQVEEASDAGRFALGGIELSDDDVAEDTDAVALVLHTSGTTARPKIVPLTHRHLLSSARNVRSTLGLQPADRCLNVMPLFHIHGIVAALLASLDAGGSVACTPGFHQIRFFEWLHALGATWTTAVPTMHQAILERSVRDPSLVTGHTLRFVRSSSASLPVPVLEGLESALGVPVVEAYGMTEAAHQMASNPLPPGKRKPGSVGLAAGPEIAVLDTAGVPLPVGEVGEVSIRGENVFAGYESNPEANATAFTDGWFRTGDEGSFDEEGYLVLRGRLKEIINRAGEKVSPMEVDDVLLRHPAVAQAVTFGVPHERLGEEVAAAVVLRDAALVGERDLQDFVAQTVAPFKVPRRIVVLDEIPKGATGKIQRIGLAERLDLTVGGTEATSRNMPLELEVAAIWADVLDVGDVAPLDDFFALGGDSILGAEAVARIRELVGRPDLPLVSIVRAPTPRAMAAEVQSEFGWNGYGVVRVQEGAAETPVFFAHALDGEIVGYAGLARLLGTERPVYALRPPGHAPDEQPPTDIESLCDVYFDGIRAAQPRGPYLLGGYCMGAAIALELTHRLAALGEDSALVLVDPRVQRPSGPRYTLWLVARRARQGKLTQAVRRRLRREQPPSEASSSSTSEERPGRGRVWVALERARDAYAPRPTTVPTALIRSRDYERYELPDWYLRRVFRRVVWEGAVPAEHVDLFRPPALASVASAVSGAITRVEES